MSIQLHNHQEEVVQQIVDFVLYDEPDLRDNPNRRNEIMAFVLNRVPPRYITGTRGFIRVVEYMQNTEQANNVANTLNLFTLVNEAIEVVRNRRAHSRDALDNTKVSVFDAANEILPVHNLPHIIGKVIGDADKLAVGEATVSLFINQTLSTPAQQSWPNPCITADFTHGNYCFWPAAIRSEDSKMNHQLEIIIDHPEFHRMVIRKKFSTSLEYSINTSIRPSNALCLNPVTLKPR